MPSTEHSLNSPPGHTQCARCKRAFSARPVRYPVGTDVVSLCQACSLDLGIKRPVNADIRQQRFA